MKKAIVILFILLIASSHLFGEWVQDKFIIMNQFGDPLVREKSEDLIRYYITNDSVDPYDSANYQLFKDAHFNLMFGSALTEDTVAYNIYCTKIGIKYRLLLASKVGIKTLIADDNCFGIGCPAGKYTRHKGKDIMPFCQDSFTSFRRFYKDSITQNEKNCIYGFLLYDEPALYQSSGDTASQIHAALKEWVKNYRDSFPDTFTYIKLLPVYAYFVPFWCNPPETTLLTRHIRYNNYLDWYSGSMDFYGGDPLIADNMQCDYYQFVDPQSGAGWQYKELFYTLKALREKAGPRPFWVHLMAYRDSQADYIEPYSQHFRYGAFSPIAYGAKGLGYFRYFYGQNDAIVNVDDAWEYNTVTDKYYKVKRINNYIEQIAGPMIMSSKSIGAYHKSNEPTGENLSNQLIDRNSILIKDISDANCFAGIFHNKGLSSDSGRIFYGFIVKKEAGTDQYDIDNRTTVTVTLNGEFNKWVYTAPSVIDYDPDAQGYSWSEQLAPYNYNTNATTFTISIARGEGRLFKIIMPDSVNTNRGDNWNISSSIYESPTLICCDDTITGSNITLRSGGEIKFKNGTKIVATVDSDSFRAYIDTSLAKVSTSKGYYNYTNPGNESHTITNLVSPGIQYSLSRNAPNPFNRWTAIKYSIREKTDVSLRVYDITGRLVKTLVTGVIDPGYYEARLTGQELASGVYFYRLQTPQYRSTHKLIILK